MTKVQILGLASEFESDQWNCQVVFIGICGS